MLREQNLGMFIFQLDDHSESFFEWCMFIDGITECDPSIDTKLASKGPLRGASIPHHPTPLTKTFIRVQVLTDIKSLEIGGENFSNTKPNI